MILSKKINFQFSGSIAIKEKLGVFHYKWSEYRNGIYIYHRDSDLLAVEYSNGTKCWYQNGKLHRDNDLPAMEFANGDKAWYKNGECHRDNDLPAVEYVDGAKQWYQNGKFIRREAAK